MMMPSGVSRGKATKAQTKKVPKVWVVLDDSANFREAQKKLWEKKIREFGGDFVGDRTALGKIAADVAGHDSNCGLVSLYVVTKQGPKVSESALRISEFSKRALQRASKTTFVTMEWLSEHCLIQPGGLKEPEPEHLVPRTTSTPTAAVRRCKLTLA